MKEVIITNESFGKFNKTKILVDDSLYKELEKRKVSDGTTFLKLLQTGRALKGLKHLIETVISKNKSAVIIFTDKPSVKTGNKFFINYNDYRKKTSGRFYSLYRETGLDGANFFLNHYFPTEFDYDKGRITESQLKKVERNFPALVKELSSKMKNKQAIINESTEIIKELKNRKKLIKQEVETLENLRKESNIYFFQTRVEELKDRLTKVFPETAGPNSWQHWIYNNNWLFGTHYQTMIEKEKIGLDSIPDFLFATIDGFIDVLEIKLPSHEIIVADLDHPGSWKWSSKSGEAIGQVVNYLYQIELNQFQIRQRIERNYREILKTNIYSIKPRAFILIGNKVGWPEEQHEGLRKLNYSLHGIEVLSYSDLILRAEQIIELYNKKL